MRIYQQEITSKGQFESAAGSRWDMQRWFKITNMMGDILFVYRNGWYEHKMVNSLKEFGCTL